MAATYPDSPSAGIDQIRAGRENIAEAARPMKLSTAVTLFLAFTFNLLVSQAAQAMQADWSKVALVAGAVFAGSIALAYVKREPSWSERYFKLITSMMTGVPIGWILETYLEVTKPAYVFGLYFFSAMLSLFFLTALVHYSEKNSVDIIKAAIQRALGLQTPEERHARKFRKAKAAQNRGRYYLKPKDDPDKKGERDDTKNE